MRQNLFKLNYYRSFKLQHKLCCIIIHRIFSTFWFFIENLKLRVQKLFKGIFKWIRSFLGFSWFFVQIHLSYFNWSNLKIQSRFNNTTINLVRPYLLTVTPFIRDRELKIRSIEYLQCTSKFELIFPNFEPSQVFELKSEPFQGKITWSIFRSEKLKGSNFEPSQSTCIYHHVKNLHRRLVELIAFPVSGFPVQTKTLLTLCVKNNKAINDLKSIFGLEFVPTWFCWKGDTYYSFSKSFNILTRCSGIPRM